MVQHWIVTGGAGYIGAHLVAALRRLRHTVTVIDDLSTGNPTRLPADVRLIVADIAETDRLMSELQGSRPSGVFHLAAKKSVKESVSCPGKYWSVNVAGTLSLLDVASQMGMTNLVFSSSAAVYGSPSRSGPVHENDALLPVSPYGTSKLAAEMAIREVCNSVGIRWISLRYFNVAGCNSPLLADRGGETLFPRLAESVLSGEPAEIFGIDYPTADRTAVRDYVHVQDVVDAHLRAMAALSEGVSDVYNIGRGVGISVWQIVREMLQAGNSSAEPVMRPRRAGDVAAIWADVDKAREHLGWTATRGIGDMVLDEVRARS